MEAAKTGGTNPHIAIDEEVEFRFGRHLMDIHIPCVRFVTESNYDWTYGRIATGVMVDDRLRRILTSIDQHENVEAVTVGGGM